MKECSHTIVFTPLILTILAGTANQKVIRVKTHTCNLWVFWEFRIDKLCNDFKFLVIYTKFIMTFLFFVVVVVVVVFFRIRSFDHSLVLDPLWNYMIVFGYCMQSSDLCCQHHL